MLMNNNEYIEIIETIKGEIRGAQYKAALSVNRELIMLYYHIGTVINEHKTWGSKFIENLAADIRIAFPNVKGYSVRNLKYMAKLANTYPDEEFVQQAVAQIPWGHTVVLLDKFLDDTVRNWYINKTIENGWSRVEECTFIGDKAYDVKAIYNTVRELYHGECVIPLNKRNTKKPARLPCGAPICEAGLAMHRDGKFTENGKTRQK